jgi:HD-like signal output (HDOD) protein
LSGLLRKESTSLAEIGRLVRFEPGLTAWVLRARRERNLCSDAPCFTIEDAINSLGFPCLHEMAEEVTRSQVFDQPLEAYNLHREEFWRWSVATALGAELLGEMTGEDPDLCFTLGLMHNVGILAVDTWIAQQSPGLVFGQREFPREFSAAEGALMGFTHAEVGATLLASWGFPSAMSEAVRAQYVPLRGGPNARRSCLLHAAKWLGAAVCSEDFSPRLPEGRHLDVLRLPSYELVKLVVEVRVKIGEVRNAVCRYAA